MGTTAVIRRLVAPAGLIWICQGVKLPTGEANIGSYCDIAAGAAGSRVALQAMAYVFEYRLIIGHE